MLFRSSRDVAALRALLQPAPSWDEATALAIDMSVLLAARQGRLNDSMYERRLAYAKLIQEEFRRLKSPDAVARALGQARDDAIQKLVARRLHCVPSGGMGYRRTL